MERRFMSDQLFRRNGEPIGDDTLNLLLDEEARRVIARQSDPGYRAAVAEEMLQIPEAVTNGGDVP